MNKSLVPKIRFKGFDDEWKKYKLNDIGIFFRGLYKKTKADFEINNSNFYYVTYTNIYNNRFIKIDSLKYVNINKNENQNHLVKGDILFTMTSETYNEVGLCSIFNSDTDNVYLNSFCSGFRIIDIRVINSIFLLFLLLSIQYREKIIKMANGFTRYNLSKKLLLNLQVKIPNIIQQNLIGQFFTIIDRKIELVKEQLSLLAKQMNEEFEQNNYISNKKSKRFDVLSKIKVSRALLFWTPIVQIIACNNSNVPIPTINTVKFKLMDRIKEATALAVDTKGNLYASDKKGNIYKCSAGENIFSEVTNIQRPVSSIVIDKNNNIFLLSTIVQQDSEIYKCLARESTFNKIESINDVYAGGKLVLDSNNNIYMGITKTNGKGDIYKCSAGETTFNKIAEIEKPFIDFTLDKNNNIYIIDNGISVYKMLSNNKDIHVINNQLFFGNNTIITDQKNKVYISNSYCGVYESD